MSALPTQIDPGLERMLTGNPNAEFYLIVLVKHADDRTEQALRRTGVTIRHRLTLLPSFAITCTGAAALELSTCSFVLRIEDDRPVTTL
jgi:hypothetical protein